LDTGWKWRIAVSLAVIAIVVYENAQRWRADSEIGIAAYVLEDAYARSLSEQHKRIYAETALTRLRQAEALNPELYENYNLQGTANMLISNHEEAARQYERAARYLPSPELLTNEAVALMAAGEKRRAQELLEKALRYNPNYVNAARALEYLKASQGGK
jgi:tetratricopeptide (TPR) repeat protein